MPGSNTILTNNGAIFISNKMSNARDALLAAQSQVASGLKNPDLARDPAGSTLAIRQEGNVTISDIVLDVIVQSSSVMNLAVGVLQSTSSILLRLKDLCMKARSANVDDVNRQQIDAEFQKLIDQIQLNATTRWGNTTLFDGSYTGQNVQIGLLTDQLLTIAFGNMSTSNLNISGANVLTSSAASNAIASVDNALTSVLNELANVASFRSRLDAASETMSLMGQNMRSVLSSYKDVDIPKALTDAAKWNAVIDAASSSLSQNINLFSKLSRMIQNSMS